MNNLTEACMCFFSTVNLFNEHVVLRKEQMCLSSYASLTAASCFSPRLTPPLKMRNVCRIKKLKRQQTLLIAEQESSQCCRRAADLCLLWFAASIRAALGIFPEILLGTCCYRPLLIWKAGLCQCVFAWTFRGTNKLFLLLISLQFVNYLFNVCACASACECLCSSGSWELSAPIRGTSETDPSHSHHSVILLSHSTCCKNANIQKSHNNPELNTHNWQWDPWTKAQGHTETWRQKSGTQQYHTESDLIVE